MKFGDYLRQRREQKNWTQPEAAAKADIEQSYLSKLETGKSYPSEDIFSRLAKVYDIDTEEMTRNVFSAELDKLREIKEVRRVVLDRQKSETTFARKWMMAGLGFLMISGASLGVAITPESARQEFYYKSSGVIFPGEGLQVYNIVEKDLSVFGANPELKDLRKKQDEMLTRLDEKYKVEKLYKGTNFVEKESNRKRFYQLYKTQEAPQGKGVFWVALGLMSLLGGIGSFFISYRWK